MQQVQCPDELINESGPLNPDDFDPDSATQIGAAAAGMLSDEGTMIEVPSDLPLSYNPDTPDQDSDSPQVQIGETLPSAEPTRIDVESGAPIQEYVENSPLPTAVIPPQPKMDDVAYNPADSGVDYSSQKTIYNQPPATGSTPIYNGEELSLNFQDIEVRSVLQLLADFTDLNIVVSDSVSGKLTLRLKNVPWDQALDIILRTKGLDKRRSGNVVMVAPAGEIAAQEAAEREAAQKAIELEPLRTDLYR